MTAPLLYCCKDGKSDLRTLDTLLLECTLSLTTTVLYEDGEYYHKRIGTKIFKGTVSTLEYRRRNILKITLLYSRHPCTVGPWAGKSRTILLQSDPRKTRVSSVANLPRHVGTTLRHSLVRAVHKMWGTDGVRHISIAEGITSIGCGRTPGVVLN